MRRFEDDVAQAIDRGFSFLARFAPGARCWRSYAPDVLYMFLHLATRSVEPELRARADACGRALAPRWWLDNPSVPRGTSPDELAVWYVYGSDSAERFGATNARMRRILAERVNRFTATEYFGFDPRVEGPPSDLPEPCECGTSPRRGQARCDGCGAATILYHRYELWQHSMVVAQIGESYGVRLGCSLDDVARLAMRMRPYPNISSPLDEAARCAFYAVTHLVYTLSDYGRHHVSTQEFGAEHDFVRAAAGVAIRHGDVEMLGESVDTLATLGAREGDPAIRAARHTLIELQNKDGSWGAARDTYTRFHSAWVAIDGLRSHERARSRSPG